MDLSSGYFVSIGAWAVFFAFLIAGSHIRVRSEILILFVFTNFSSVMLLVYPVVLGTYDLTVPLHLMQLSINYLIVGIVFERVFFRGKSLSGSLLLLFLPFVTQAVLMLLMFSIPSVKELWLRVVTTRPGILAYYDYRFIGVTGFASYSIGVTQAVGVVLGIVLLSIRGSAFVFVATILVASSSVLAARSSLITLGLVLLVCLSVRQTRVATVRVFGALAAIGILIFGTFDFLEMSTVSRLIVWAKEPIDFIFGTGELNSLKTLTNWYARGFDDRMLLGSGFYTNEDGMYFGEVDAGYIRLALYFGVGPSLLFYFSYAFFFFLTFFAIKKHMNKVEFKLVKCFFLLIPICMFLFNIKGSFFVDGSSLVKLYVLIVTIITASNHLESPRTRRLLSCA